MESLLSCVYIFFIFSTFGGAVEEFCTDYPGEVSFLYETTTNRTAYNIKYGLHRKKSLRSNSTADPHQPTAIPPDNIQLMKNKINQEETKTGDKTTKHLMHTTTPISMREKRHHWYTTTSTYDEDYEDEEEEAPLPVWKLSVPRNVIKVTVERIEDGKAVDKFVLDNEHLENKNLTSYSSNEYEYKSFIDVTSNGIIVDAWYAICMSMSVIVKKLDSTCLYCTLLKTSTNSGNEGVAFKLKKRSGSDRAATVRVGYNVNDLPFPKASAITKVYPYTDRDNRCMHIDEVNTTIESVDPIKPNTVVYVELSGLSESSDYSITTELVAEWKDDPKRAPLTALFYQNPEKTQTISKCRQNAKN